jgi:hypothetical protein
MGLPRTAVSLGNQVARYLKCLAVHARFMQPLLRHVLILPEEPAYVISKNTSHYCGFRLPASSGLWINSKCLDAGEA